jgi:lysylphosphatidylglycerol synthetase-like protein (DUF2156 family)
MKKPLKTASWAGIIMLISAVLLSLFFSFTEPSYSSSIFLAFILMIVLLASGIFFYYGHVVLSKKYKSPMLQVTSWIAIGAQILLLFLMLIVGLFASLSSVSAEETLDPAQTLDNSAYFAIFLVYILVYIIISLALGVYSILFGVGLLNIKDKVEYARASGILNIIAGATYIIFIGYFISLAGMVVEIVMLFTASKKLKL